MEGVLERISISREVLEAVERQVERRREDLAEPTACNPRRYVVPRGRDARPRVPDGSLDCHRPVVDQASLITGDVKGFERIPDLNVIGY
jgi:hypothetical protein